MTGCSSTGGHQISNPCQQYTRVNILETNAQSIGESTLGMFGTVHQESFGSQSFCQFEQESASHGFHVCSILREFFVCLPSRVAQSYNVRSILCPSTPTKFLTSANEHNPMVVIDLSLVFFQATWSDIQCSDSFWRSKFVTHNGNHIWKSQICQLTRDLSCRLSRICMHENSPFPALFCQSLDWLQGSRFVVCQHEGYQNCIFCQSINHILGIHPTVCAHWNVGNRGNSLLF
mmetsp:Transcript_15560/g.38387  ORF Transcript_15560/g.38387 Transcript_15560/m.38387 type:complete len:232 (+) Transcript_15560:764-1459(+)